MMTIFHSMMLEMAEILVIINLLLSVVSTIYTFGYGDGDIIYSIWPNIKSFENEKSWRQKRR